MQNTYSFLYNCDFFRNSTKGKVSKFSQFLYLMAATYFSYFIISFMIFFSDNMGGNKLKQRDSTNPKSNPVSQLNVNERILKECHQLYMEPENGLVEVRLFFANSIGKSRCLYFLRLIFLLIFKTKWKLNCGFFTLFSFMAFLNNFLVKITM